MLTDAEVRRLLAAVMAYDNRKPGQATVAAWTEAAGRGRWSFPEALDAVHQHYASETTWLMPGHVTQAIKAARQDAAMRAPQGPVPDAIGQARLVELTAGAFAALEPAEQRDAGDPVRRAALTRPCSYCDAVPGRPCTRRSLTGRTPLAKVHPARLEGS